MNFKNLLTISVFSLALFTELYGATRARRNVQPQSYATGYKEVTSVRQLDNEVKQAKPTIVKFYTKSCGACNQFKDIFNKVASSNSRANFLAVNIEDENDNATKEFIKKYNVEHVPVVLFFRNGKEIKREVGLMEEKDFAKEVQDFVNNK